MRSDVYDFFPRIRYLLSLEAFHSAKREFKIHKELLSSFVECFPLNDGELSSSVQKYVEKYIYEEALPSLHFIMQFMLTVNEDI